MTTETIYLPLNATTEAVVTLTIREDGLGPLDPARETAPSVSQMELIARLILKRGYMFTSSLD